MVLLRFISLCDFLIMFDFVVSVCFGCLSYVVCLVCWILVVAVCDWCGAYVWLGCLILLFVLCGG